MYTKASGVFKYSLLQPPADSSSRPEPVSDSVVLRLPRYVNQGLSSERVPNISAYAGGFSEGANSTPVPDWVDENVAEWIKLNVAAMDAAWGPAEEVDRGALAFVHIPP